MNPLRKIFKNEKPIIGMIHLKPLPGSPLYDPTAMDFQKVLSVAVEEAKILEAAGVDGVQVENIWDYPYLKGEKIGYETSAALAVAASKVMDSVSIPVGVNCHLNGGMAALAAATAAGAQWIRVFEWVNAYVSHAGITQGIGGELARYKKSLQSPVEFFCDINVKHGSHFMIHDRTVMDQAKDAVDEGAEVLIVTGFETGKAPSVDKINECKGHVSVPVLLGSGITTENAYELLSVSDGAIVGSWFKEGNNWKNPVDFDRTKAFMDEVQRLRKDL